MSNIKKVVPGSKFNMLTVIEYVYSKNWTRYWKCMCDCGGTTFISTEKLGMTKSCGCVGSRYKTGKDKAQYKHGMHSTLEYYAWRNMINRCIYPNTKGYERYGGRGIVICDRWLGEQGFVNFYNDMGDKPKGMTLERKDVNGNYEPSNCEWASWHTQQNNRSNTQFFTIDDVTKSLSDWCIFYDIPYRLVDGRLRYGWDIKRALNTPILRK